MNDYYREQSFVRLKVEGKCFKFVTVSKKRSEYAAANTGPAKTALLGEALDALYKRDGKEALKGFDGIFFLYAGDRVQTNRGGLYWPHKSFVTHQGQRWPYFIVQEGAARMCDISVICHEFGHMLGLPDLYARPENPGSEGVGVWCAMSNQVGGGRPQHFSAWSKEQLGWITPAILDPTVKQKLILAPVENSAKECFKVLARPDGSEYFLLENRRKKGFDSSLPAEGLLIWRVVQGRPILEESHGIEGPMGPRVFLDSVPFPSPANRAFTPYTTPSSRAQLGGGLPVHITNIRRLPDGRITFFVGYEYY
ncbi:MAG: M6 family metalloprotease domain-containing protein [Planctomycetes bacterium]|nr:M6 family metalloprotease domain-containing protein [Planctomycetota bacterium]